MQRRDERHKVAAQHHLREVGADRMWNRVVHMKDVEIETGHDLCHLRRQNEVVRWVFEQRIRQNFHLVEEDVVLHGQPDGQSVTDEVNVVTALRELLPQFGGNDAAAAVGRITGDPDLHISTT